MWVFLLHLILFSSVNGFVAVSGLSVEHMFHVKLVWMHSFICYFTLRVNYKADLSIDLD